MSESVVAQMRAALERALSPSLLEIVDDSARHAGHTGARGGGHFKVTLVADAFRGRSVALGIPCSAPAYSTCSRAVSRG